MLFGFVVVWFWFVDFGVWLGVVWFSWWVGWFGGFGFVFLVVGLMWLGCFVLVWWFDCLFESQFAGWVVLGLGFLIDLWLVW